VHKIPGTAFCVFRLILSLISHLRVRILSVFSAGIQDAFCLSPSVLILFNEGFYYDQLFSSARCNRTFGKTGLGNGCSQGLCLHKKRRPKRESNKRHRRSKGMRSLDRPTIAVDPDIVSSD
jgi:hypothetical protein